MNTTEINEILDAHSKWLRNTDEGVKANLREANLCRANLRGANLYGADLYGADLYGANLREANLREANLYGADLYGADLYGANLYGADLRGAILYGANLRRAKNISSFIFEKHLAVFFIWKEEKYIKIGCMTYTVSEWVEKFKEVGIDEGYTAEQAKAYGLYIKLCNEVSFNE